MKNGDEVSKYTRGQEIFMAYFQELYGEAYGWEAKDTVAIKKIFGKIEYNRKTRDKPLPIDDDSLVAAFGQFIRSINKSWIMNNFSLSKINSQYNEIISEIKNRRNGTNNTTNHPQASGSVVVERQRAACVDDIAKADELYYKGK